MRARPRQLAAASSLLVVVACGPSFQAIYEGDQRFEHCYALDDNPSAPLQEKSTCWRDWMAHYTYGQTRDRVEYAAVRARALGRVPALPTDEALMEAAPGGMSSKPGVAAPAPTSAFAPPPKTIAVANAPTAPSPPPSTPSTASTSTPAPPGSVVFVAPAHAVAVRDAAPPASACQDVCMRSWESCQGRTEALANDACGKTYKGCMRGCFK